MVDPHEIRLAAAIEALAKQAGEQRGQLAELLKAIEGIHEEIRQLRFDIGTE